MPDSKSELDASIKEDLDAIEAEGGKIENDPRPKPAPKPEPEKPAEPAPKPETPEPKPKPSEEPKPKTEEVKGPKMMPRYQHIIAEKNWEKEKSELVTTYESKLAELNDQIKKGASKPDIKETTEDLAKIAEELGVDPKVYASIIENARKGMKPAEIPKELQELAKLAPELAKQREKQAENDAENAFIDEFTKDVLPLIEAEYGVVPGEQLSKIRESLKAKVLSDPKLYTSPLHLIYNGSKDFRGIVLPDKPTGEKGKGGAGREETVDFDNMTEEQFDKLSDDDQNRYADYMRRKK